MSKFAEFSTRYFKRYFELHPTDAIYYGVEGYDHLLNDYSDKSYKAEKIFVKESLRKLHQIAPSDLSGDEAIDYVLLEGRLTIQIYEQAKEDYRLRQPDTYSPIEAIYILTVRATNDFHNGDRNDITLLIKYLGHPDLFANHALHDSASRGGLGFKF